MSENEFLVPPSIEEFLNLDECGMHEIVFHFTGWPKDGNFMYYPDPTKPFYPHQYGCVFENMFDELEKAIKYGYLPGRHSKAIKGVPFNVRPHDAILWAIFNDITLPVSLQSAINFYQIDNSAKWKRSNRAITHQIVFQCIFTEDSTLCTLKDFLMHPWLKKHCFAGEYGDRNERKALKKQLLNAIGFKAKRGSQTSISKLSLKLISEVMSLNNGHKHFYIKALKKLLLIVCEIKVEELLKDAEKLRKITPSSFMEEVIRHPVVIPYVQNASDMLLKIIRVICKPFVRESPILYEDEKTFTLSNIPNRHFKN